MESIITKEVVAKNLDHWREIAELIQKCIREVEDEDFTYQEELLMKKIRKEKKKLDKVFDAPTDVESEEWYEWLRDPYNWEIVDYVMDKKRRCCEESCKEETVDKGKRNKNDFYRAKGDNTYLLCEDCYYNREDNEIIWAKREVVYYSETDKQKKERATNPKEWYIDEDEIKDGDWHDIKCVQDECWYKGNLDRMSGYGEIHRLRGHSEDIILCDICFCNRQYLEIDWPY